MRVRNYAHAKALSVQKRIEKLERDKNRLVGVELKEKEIRRLRAQLRG